MNEGLIPTEYILYVSLIVLFFDIVWQFAVAGVYAPRKARRLIVEDDMFIDMRTKLEYLDCKYVRITSEIIDLKNKIKNSQNVVVNSNGDLNRKLQSFQNQLCLDLNEKLDAMVDHLKASFSGSIGREMRDYYESIDNPLDGQGGGLALVASDLPVKPSPAERKVLERQTLMEAEYEICYSGLSPFVGEEKADEWAAKYAGAPRFLKKLIKNKIKDMGFDLDE